MNIIDNLFKKPEVKTVKYNFEKKRNDYLTPPEIYNQVLELFNKQEFECDVCCDRDNIPAKNHFIEGAIDGLKAEWFSFNWCNPPFDKCEKWIKKAYEEQQKGRTTVMILPVRTETAYWHKYILDNERGCIKFLRKGTAFINPDTNLPVGVYKNPLALVSFIGVDPEGEV